MIVVHLYGQCVDMDPILEVCNRYEIPILEDASEALGSSYKSKLAGTLGDVAAFSFNGNKIITTSGGGMLVSRDADRIAKARFWATQARDPGIAYEHSEIGYNYRMSNVLAGIGRGQLEVLDLRVQQRRAIAFRYRDAFADLPGISLMPQAPYGVHTNWLSCFLIDEAKVRLFARPAHRPAECRQRRVAPCLEAYALAAALCPIEALQGEIAEDLFRRGICLPSSSSLSLEDQLHVINQIRTAAGADSLAELGDQSLVIA